jgi:hypothetical protein
VLSALLLTGADQAWKTKQYPEWSEDDAKEVMTNSPWAKSVVVTPVKPNGKTGEPETHHGRFGIGGFGIGRGGGGAGRHASDQTSKSTPDQPATLTLRWESAQPMREAELKARDIGAPDVGDDFYAIAVYGIPRGMVADDSKERQDELKRLAILKREGKSDLKPTRVDILLRESGPLVVYLFSKSAEFNWRDHGITFEGQIARLKFSQAFSTDDMMFHGKLEL